VENPRNVSAITLRSGKNIKVPTSEPTPSKEVDPATFQRKRDAHATGPSTSGVTFMPSTSTAAPSTPLPFPSRAIPSKKMEEVDIGNNKFENAMLDLGALINVMPLSIFKSLSLEPP